MVNLVVTNVPELLHLTHVLQPQRRVHCLTRRHNGLRSRLLTAATRYLQRPAHAGGSPTPFLPASTTAPSSPQLTASVSISRSLRPALASPQASSVVAGDPAARRAPPWQAAGGKGGGSTRPSTEGLHQQALPPGNHQALSDIHASVPGNRQAHTCCQIYLPMRPTKIG